MLRELKRAPLWVKGLLGLIALVVVGALIAAAAGDDDQRTTTPRTTNSARGGTGCTAAEALNTLNAIGRQETLSRAAETALTAAIAGSVADLIVDLRASRADFIDNHVPACGEGIKADLVAAHDELIAGLTGLSANAPSDEVATHIELATAHMKRATDAIATISP